MLPLDAVLKTGVIENATGSAYVESGRLKVICAAWAFRPDPVCPSLPCSPFTADHLVMDHALLEETMRRRKKVNLCVTLSSHPFRLASDEATKRLVQL